MDRRVREGHPDGAGAGGRLAALHLALDGVEGEEAAAAGFPPGPPPEWLISRVCEEFQCLPSEAVRELEEGDARIVLDVMDLRDYARAKAALDAAKDEKDVPVSAAVDRVWGVMHEIKRRRQASRA